MPESLEARRPSRFPELGLRLAGTVVENAIPSLLFAANASDVRTRFKCSPTPISSRFALRVTMSK